MDYLEQYSSLAQRAAASYLRLLVNYDALALEQAGEVREQQRDLWGFFKAFYVALYERPDQFGLPILPDDSFVPGEPNGTERKAELNRKLKRPRELIGNALAFLMLVGRDGRLEGSELVGGEDAAQSLKKIRGLRAFLQALSAAGLAVQESAGSVRLADPRFPAMMPALQALAKACAGMEDAKLGAVHFARCDFRALQPGYQLDALDLYRTLPAKDFTQLRELHEYFIEKNYKVIVVINSMFTWMVQYQGKRQVKSTPLFQVEYQERHRDPTLMFIKPASVQRIAPLVPQQSRQLQDDFFARANYCPGKEKCGWCETHPNLGPTSMKRDGKPVVVCWYINPDIDRDEHTVDLVKEYAEMHAALAP